MKVDDGRLSSTCRWRAVVSTCRVLGVACRRGNCWGQVRLQHRPAKESQRQVVPWADGSDDEKNIEKPNF